MNDGQKKVQCKRSSSVGHNHRQHRHKTSKSITGKSFKLLLTTGHFFQIKLDIVDDGAATEYGGYDQSNALVLPSEKRRTKIKKDKESNVTRILSKKQRKNLEKIVDKKKKKEGVGTPPVYFDGSTILIFFFYSERLCWTD